MQTKKRLNLPAVIPQAVILGILAVALIVVTALRVSALRDAPAESPASPAPGSTVPATPVPSGAHGVNAQEQPAASQEPPGEPTPTPVPTPIPDPEYFTISLIGDCSLASNPDKKGWAIAYESVINGDLSYSFANTREYFTDDYLTIANLEGNLSNNNYSSIEWFTFLSPASYANILTDGGVDFVTLANNHTMDFGQNAYNDTTAALDAVNLPYAGEDELYIYQSEGGLKVGIYCLYNRLTGNALDLISAAQKETLVTNSKSMIDAAAQELRAQGAEYLVICLHMGREGYYEPMEIQTEMCRYSIDTGFDLVYCTHAHRLQPAEKYGDGMIFYGMGNWIFGGHTNPGNGTDPGAYDTGIAQITVCRRGDSVTLESFNFIPCCISSNGDLTAFVPNPNTLNNYQPTPYEPDSTAWNRAMSMLNGTYEGANYITDYGNVLAAMNG